MRLHPAQEAAYLDDVAVGALTREIVRRGCRVLQVHLLAPTVDGHVARLLEEFSPPFGARVLDVGCGVGGVAEAMSWLRPDLGFVLLNRSRAQLEMCPAGFETVEADFHAMPFPNASFDAAMLCYVIGHGVLEEVLFEAARVLNPGGVALLYDFTVEGPARLLESVGYLAHPVEAIREAAALAGFSIDVELRPDTNTDEFRRLFDDSEAVARAFDGVTPLLMRMEKAA